MLPFPPTIILRHRRENLKKCSLKGLEKRADFIFYSYPWKNDLPDVSNYCVLSLQGPPLTSADASCGLFLIDGTWRYAAKMAESLPKTCEKRSIPSHFLTAYPRRQEDCEDPMRGLASIEALFIAFQILGRDIAGLLDQYYWKEDFLEKNFFSRESRANFLPIL